MILVFDLDDTLYDESTFVKSGFRAVSLNLYSKYGIPVSDSYNSMINFLNINGRGQVFDEMLKNFDIYSKANVRKAVGIYRGHRPNITLFEDARRILEYTKKYNKYIVTDGNKFVQKRKIEALKIRNNFKKVITTRQFGIKNEKPSLFCFDMIKRLENCNWGDITYIGDNPKKDFVNLNVVGANTIRVKRGQYSNSIVPSRYDANLIIDSLDEAIKLIF